MAPSKAYDVREVKMWVGKVRQVREEKSGKRLWERFNESTGQQTQKGLNSQDG